MKMEIKKAWQNRQKREKKSQEKAAMEVVKAAQPKTREFRYDNVKSAKAEEGLIAMAMREPALLDQTGDLQAEAFSVPVFSKVYAQITQRHRNGLSINMAVLEDLSNDEASHVAMVLQNQSGPVNEQAFNDFVSIIRSEHRKSGASTIDDLMAMREKMKESKGLKG
jgi:DNA primase